MLKLISATEAIILVSQWATFSKEPMYSSTKFCSCKKDGEEYNIYF